MEIAPCPGVRVELVTYGHISTLGVLFLPVSRMHVCISTKPIAVPGLLDTNDIIKIMGSKVTVTENL